MFLLDNFLFMRIEEDRCTLFLLTNQHEFGSADFLTEEKIASSHICHDLRISNGFTNLTFFFNYKSKIIILYFNL